MMRNIGFKIYSAMWKTLWINNKHCLPSILIGLLTGVVTYFALLILFSWVHLIIKPDINLEFDIAGLIGTVINIVLVLIVLRTLHRRDEGEKVERELLIDHFVKFESGFCNLIHQFMMDTQEVGVDGSKLASALREQGMSLQELVELTRSYYSGSGDEIKDLEDSVAGIRDMLTNTPREGSVEDGVRLTDDGKILYSSRYVGDISAAVGRFKKAIFAVIVSINRS